MHRGCNSIEEEDTLNDQKGNTICVKGQQYPELLFKQIGIESQRIYFIEE